MAEKLSLCRSKVRIEYAISVLRKSHISQEKMAEKLSSTGMFLRKGFDTLIRSYLIC